MPQDRKGILAQVLTVAQMRAAEEMLVAGGTGVDALMQTAGHGAGEYVRRVAAGRSVTVLCGPGNNGGDGYVIAEHLRAHGNPVVVVAACDPATDAARVARQHYGGDVMPPEADVRGDVLVDCLFGSGLTRPMSDRLLALLVRLGASHAYRVAIDVPSGIECDSALALNHGLPDWHLTIALGAWKYAHFGMPSSVAMGALRLVDIGAAAMPNSARILTRPRLCAPAPDAHKYTRGLLAIVGGAMPGAPLLSAEAAMRAGAGYVRLLAEAHPEGGAAALVTDVVPEIDDLRAALDHQRLAAALIGPGLGRDARAQARLRGVMARGVPTVVDADALHLLDASCLPGAASILTPHEGEMVALERSFGLKAAALRRDRAVALAARADAVVVLKGPDTVIASPKGNVTLAPRASSWLSVAGSGDVLAGIVASRLAVHGDAWAAACEGVWLHGEAARLSGPAFTATDLAIGVRAALGNALS